jgi:hypothetical protein
MNQGMPRQRRILRVLAPIEELIPMAPIPETWERVLEIEGQKQPKQNDKGK